MVAHENQQFSKMPVGHVLAAAAMIMLDFCTLARAADITFLKIADTNTPVPGGTGNFMEFSSPSLAGGNVAFRSLFAMYLYRNGVLNPGTAIPPFNPESEIGYSFDGERLALVGNRVFYPDALEGVFTSSGAPFAPVVGSDTPRPDRPGTFNNTVFGIPSISAGAIAFTGGGLYTASGASIQLVAGPNTPVPGGMGNFVYPHDPSLDGNTVAFSEITPQGFSGGVYVATGDTLSVVADSSTPIPNGTGMFRVAGAASLDGQHVAFFGSDNLQQDGIYTNRSGPLQVVVDRHTLVPGTATLFAQINDFCFDDGRIAFTGTASLGMLGGAYLEMNGTMLPILRQGDLLDGKTVSFAGVGHEGLDGTQLALHVSFTDGTIGIYVATVPEPASWVLLALTIPAFLLRAVRRRRDGRTDLQDPAVGH